VVELLVLVPVTVVVVVVVGGQRQVVVVVELLVEVVEVAIPHPGIVSTQVKEALAVHLHEPTQAPPVVVVVVLLVEVVGGYSQTHGPNRVGKTLKYWRAFSSGIALS
jgi:hypothetical protein